jgi:1,3,6,8-tetrahydroxynaphthalene synthase
VVLPDHEVTMDSLKAMAQRVLEGRGSMLPRLLRIIDNSGIKSRRIVRSMEASVVPSGFGHRNDLFIETSKRLGEEAAVRAIESANLEAKDIHLIITTSCTGIMTPSLDGHLITKMSFGPRTKRLPITELGCAAGTVAMSRAREFILAHPGQNVLIVAHELSSVTYQPADFNMAALIGALLFGDGVTATVVRGDGGGRGLQLDANESFLFQDSWGYMGFDVRDSGIHLILDKGIPGAVERQIAPVLLGFLDS